LNDDIQGGGGERDIPLYQEPRINPSIPNEQKRIYATRKEETERKLQQQPVPQPMINFQYYEPKQQMMGRPMGPEPANFLATQQMYGNSMMVPMQAPVLAIDKSYKINVGSIGPNINHAKMYRVYEDALPPKLMNSTLKTLNERISIYDFIKATIFSGSDGENIGMDEYAKGKSLVNYVKYDELNPYNTYKYSDNKYKGMPKNFMLYRSCYPIRQGSGNTSMCAPNSLSVNIRIYRITNGSYEISKTHTNFYDYDEWNEVAYYEFIREKIMKKYVCPNFVNMYGYFISDDCRIKFDDINLAMNNKNALVKEPEYIDAKPEDIGQLVIPRGTVGQPQQQNQQNQQKQVKTLIQNPKAYTGKALIILTESPTYNLFNWASKTYHRLDKGDVRRMVNSGVHDEKVWFSVLFQLMAALYVMQINGIYLDNFDMANNVFIKDISHESVTKFWKYKIDDIDYYIPNNGFVVMINSNFKDLPNAQTDLTILQKAQGEKQTHHKIGGSCVGNPLNLTPDQLKEKSFEMFKNVFNANIYGEEFIRYGGCRPPEAVIRMLENIVSEASSTGSKNIGHYIVGNMKIFIHNRVGTYLKETELNNIRRHDNSETEKGEIMVLDDSSGSSIYVMYLSVASDKAQIITKNKHTDTDYIQKDVPITSLHKYSKAEPIQQNFKPTESSLNDDDLLETYTIKQE